MDHPSAAPPVADASGRDCAIDIAAIARFCEIVFGYLEGPVPIRCLGEAGLPEQPPRATFVDVTALPDRLIELAGAAARTHRGVFVLPGTVLKAGSARADNLHQSGVLLVDLDAGDIGAKRNHLTCHLGAPSLVVASGGVTAEGQAKLHLYWRLSEAVAGVELRRAGALRAEIAARVGGDPSLGRVTQLIRVPGTIHGKHGRQSPVRILADTGGEHHFEELAEAIAAMPPLAGEGSDGSHQATTKRDATLPGPTARDLALTPVRAGAVGALTRFDALSKVIGHWVRTARLGTCSPDEAWTAVADHNAAMVVPPWDEARLRHEFDALLRKDRDLHPGAWAHQDASGGPAPTRFSDDAIAETFVTRHGRDWRYVATWNEWFRWTGQVWQLDDTRAVREVMRQVCRIEAADADSPPDAKRISSDKTISAGLRVAGADPRIATAPDQWDTDPMRLNTPGGIVDLRTGEIVPHDRHLLLRQITSASPGTACQLWGRFLDDITEGDGEMQAYLARLAGYVLTGSIDEQVFAFFHGNGSNGKSVFLDVLMKVMGSYARTATLSTFMKRKSDPHLSELAGLMGARLVRVGETDQRRSWNEVLIKSVTGGESLRVNRMRENHFEFQPTFKLLVTGNHRPALDSVGHAIKRRLHLVPFTATFEGARRIDGYEARLLEERDGILGWMLAGCAEWRRIGLAPPARVRDAVETYFEDEDTVGQWIAECCETGARHQATFAALFRSWRVWCEAGGHHPGTAKAFGGDLETRGFTSCMVQRSRGRRGIALRAGEASGT